MYYSLSRCIFLGICLKTDRVMKDGCRLVLESSKTCTTNSLHYNVPRKRNKRAINYFSLVLSNISMSHIDM